MQQVASVWTVSTARPVGHIWDDSGIERLTGKGAVIRIWNKLKADELTGFPKRPCTVETEGVAKRRKLQVSP